MWLKTFYQKKFRKQLLSENENKEILSSLVLDRFHSSNSQGECYDLIMLSINYDLDIVEDLINDYESEYGSL